MKYDMGLDITPAQVWEASKAALALGEAPGAALLQRLASDELAQVMNRYERTEEGGPYQSSFILLVKGTLDLPDSEIDAVLVPMNLGTFAEFVTPAQEA